MCVSLFQAAAARASEVLHLSSSGHRRPCSLRGHVNREAGLDLRPFAEVPAPGQTSPPAKKIKQKTHMYGTKNNCAQTQLGQNYGQRIQNKPKKPNCHF